MKIAPLPGKVLNSSPVSSIMKSIHLLPSTDACRTCENHFVGTSSGAERDYQATIRPLPITLPLINLAGASVSCGQLFRSRPWLTCANKHCFTFKYNS